MPHLTLCVLFLFERLKLSLKHEKGRFLASLVDHLINTYLGKEVHTLLVKRDSEGSGRSGYQKHERKPRRRVGGVRIWQSDA